MHKFVPLIKSIFHNIREALRESGSLQISLMNKEDYNGLNLLLFERDIIDAAILLLHRTLPDLGPDDVIFVSQLQQHKIAEQQIIDIIEFAKKSPDVRI